MADQRSQQVKTPISEAEMTKLFLDGAKDLFNISLTKPQVGILIAQNNLETGHRQHMYNYNIGNITHVPGDGFNYFIHQDADGKDLKLKEQVKPGVWVPQTMRFRAYSSAQEGVKDYLKNLYKRGGGAVWKAILQENPSTFSKELKKSKYYTADEEDRIDPITGKIKPGYTSGIVNSLKEFNKSKSYENAVANNFIPYKNSPSQPIKQNFLTKIDTLLNTFLSSIASLENK